MTSYPAQVNDSSGVERFVGQVVFTDAANQPAVTASPTFTGVVSAPAYASTDIASGALPTTTAWATGTAKQLSSTKDRFLSLEITFDGTANASDCVIALSPNNSDYSTVATPGVSAAINTVGGIVIQAGVFVPAAWYVKLTFGAHTAVAAGTYW